MEDSYQLFLKECSGKDIRGFPFQMGIPLPRGEYYLASELALRSNDNRDISCEFIATCFWPDSSLKWCLVKAIIDLSAYQEVYLSIFKKHSPELTVPNIKPCLVESDDSIVISTRNCSFSCSSTTFGLFQQVVSGKVNLASDGYCQLITPESEKLNPCIHEFEYENSIASSRIQSITVHCQGEFETPSGTGIARFEASMEFFLATDSVKCSFSIHNPKPAIHDSGLWDLGDPNSLIISSLDLGFRVDHISTVNWQAESEDPLGLLLEQPLTIYQESSGGQNWDSPAHKDSTNKVPLIQNGYECRNLNSVIRSGKRASPVIKASTETGQVSASINQFWQNCPKSLSIDENQVNLGLFPRQFSNGYELQPGEKKTHSFYLDFSPQGVNHHHLENSVEVSLNPVWVENTGVFPCFDTNVSNDALYDIFQDSLTGDSNFFDKREIVDEYGWRNFGDIYADHETDGYEGDDLFVSHYNNQYDPIYGFLRQFALSGNAQWFDLANDLAHHVTDIDIYHTSHDKDEYNNGLFWHTDHYLDAKTSSHRSYSKHHQNNAYVDHAGGGGPGGQHCYTTGLLYHYLMTGNEASRKAVFQLVDWISYVYEGSGTLFDVLIAIKNRYRVDLKNIETGKYPLDRGTGNYINALLDRYTLTHEHNVLKQIEHIIQNTVHPLDDHKIRRLDNVEISWFYTAFFQSVCRYLQIKEELLSLDDDFYYARDALLHYANWMVENEYPYLQKPEMLEFPNHTWTAQDLRKVNVLLFASYYSADRLSPYSTRMKEIYTYITTTLKNEKTRTYTRILAILMQNHGAVTFFNNNESVTQFEPVREYQPARKHSQFWALWNITSAFIKAIRNFSIKKELRWLGRRSETIAKLLNYKP